MSADQHKALGFAFGGVSCMAAAFVTHPVDTIKVRLQLQGELAKRTAAHPPAGAAAGPAPIKYKGFIRGLLTIMRDEGVAGVYKGLSASLLREGTYSTLRMGLYEPFKHALRSEGEQREPLWKKVVAAGGSGMIGSAVANPTDLIKVRMQAQTSELSQGALAIGMDIWRKEGLRGLYRGVGPTTQRAIVLCASQLPSYDHSKRLLLESGYMSEGILAHFVCSMFAGLVCATATSPIDTIKSRYMNQKFGPDGVGLKYSSALDCFQKTMQTEGVRGLFKGWLPQWMRLGPHTIITFLILEQLRSIAGIQPV